MVQLRVASDPPGSRSGQPPSALEKTSTDKLTKSSLLQFLKFSLFRKKNSLEHFYPQISVTGTSIHRAKTLHPNPFKVPISTVAMCLDGVDQRVSQLSVRRSVQEQEAKSVLHYSK